MSEHLLVSVADMIKYMSSINLSADQTEGVEDALENAQGELESFLNRAVMARTVVDEFVTEGRNGFLFTRYTPVTTVASVTRDDGTVIDATRYHVVNGIIRLKGAFYASPVTWDALYGPPSSRVDAGYVVSYTSSLTDFYPEALGACRGFIMRVAAREVQNNHDDTLSAKDLTTDDVTPVPPGPTDADFKRVDRWRRPVVSTSAAR